MIKFQSYPIGRGGVIVLYFSKRNFRQRVCFYFSYNNFLFHLFTVLHSVTLRIPPSKHSNSYLNASKEWMLPLLNSIPSNEGETFDGLLGVHSMLNFFSLGAFLLNFECLTFVTFDIFEHNHIHLSFAIRTFVLNHSFL